MQSHGKASLGKPHNKPYVVAMAKAHISQGNAPSQRQLRVGELIRRSLSELLMRDEVHDPDLHGMSVTVAEVQVSKDLKIAVCYVMPLGGKNQELAIEALNRNRGELRRLVSKKAALKHSPMLRFRIDDTFERMEESRRLFSSENVRRDIEE